MAADLPISPAVDDVMDRSSLLGAAAHASRNVSALLEAAADSLPGQAPAAPAARTHEILQSAMWRQRSLSASLELAALEPADVELAARQEPRLLSWLSLKADLAELTADARVSWGLAPDVGDCPSLLDRHTFMAVFICLAECIRRSGQGEEGLRVKWRVATPTLAQVSGLAAPGWCLSFSPALAPSALAAGRRMGIHERALLRAGALLQPLGLLLELAHPGETSLVLRPKSPDRGA